MVESEKWLTAKVPKKDQELTNSILRQAASEHQADQPAHGEELKAQDGEPTEPAPSDFLVSTGSSDDSAADRKYKVVGSLLDFQKVICEFLTLAKEFESLASEAGLKLLELIQQYNHLVCKDILGGEAYKRQKVKVISSKHLGKSDLPSR